MIKLTRLLVLSFIITWIAGSGCIGDNTPKEKEIRTGSNGIGPNGEDINPNGEDINPNGEDINPNSEDARNVTAAGDLEVGLSQAELKELDSDMKDLEGLLENSSLGEEIVIEDVEAKK